MIDDLKDIRNKIINFKVRENCYPPSLAVKFSTNELQGEMFCPSCGAQRLMDIAVIYHGTSEFELNNICVMLSRGNSDENNLDKAKELGYKCLSPMLMKYVCRQCKLKSTALIYEGPNGQDLVVMPERNGGISTPNTPISVSYYLDQAYRSKSIGAKSAAAAMYRAALDQILFEQGYMKGMLGDKLIALRNDINSGKAAKWAMLLEIDFLKYLKTIGNGSIHTNNGDIKKQEAIDNELLEKIDIVFSMLLFRIYEVQNKQNEWLSALKSKSTILDK